MSSTCFAVPSTLSEWEAFLALGTAGHLWQDQLCENLGKNPEKGQKAIWQEIWVNRDIFRFSLPLIYNWSR